MNVIAVDVGTTSVRLAIVSFRDSYGHEVDVIASHKKDIGHQQDGFKFEQSSNEIWRAVCECSRECLRKASQVTNKTMHGIIESIEAIAFSATCSLVIQEPPNDVIGSKQFYDVIMWMDHRAIQQAEAITNSGDQVLHQFGGTASPEFSLSKLAWLREQQPRRFEAATGFFELPDWLVYRCVNPGAHDGSGRGSDALRSLCCMVCKWGFDAEKHCHCDIVQSLGNDIEDKIGPAHNVLKPGLVAGRLSLRAARELGLICAETSGKENFNPQRVTVGTSLIDAHAGMLAMLSIAHETYGGASSQRIESTLCSLAGTSSCHMLMSRSPKFTKGIWGPYKNVVLDGYYLLEAGQSLTGKLIEMCIESHPDGKARLLKGETMYDIIAELNLQALSCKTPSKLHVLPTFHGNRSPLANPRLRGGIYGLTAEGDRGLLQHYMATVDSIIYEMRLIVETLELKLDTLLVSGGLMKNAYYMHTLADVLGCKIVRMSLKDVDFMVLGSALVAYHAALHASKSSTKAMTLKHIDNFTYKQLDFETYEPCNIIGLSHEPKYLSYKEFVAFSQRVDQIMQNEARDDEAISMSTPSSPRA